MEVVKHILTLHSGSFYLSRNGGDIPLPSSLPRLSAAQTTQHRHLVVPWVDVPKLLNHLLRWRFANDAHLVIAIFAFQLITSTYHPSDRVFILSPSLTLLNSETMGHLVWDGHTSTKV